MKPKAEYYLYSMTINLNAISRKNRTDKAGYKNKNYKYDDYVNLIDKLNNYLKEYDKKVCICFSISHLSMSKKLYSKYHLHASIMGLDYHEMEITKLAIKDFFKDNYSICKKNGNTLNNVLNIKGYNPNVTEFALYKNTETYNYLWYLFYQTPQAISNKIYNNTNYIITDSTKFTDFLLRNKMINQRFEPNAKNVKYWIELALGSISMMIMCQAMNDVLNSYRKRLKNVRVSLVLNDAINSELYNLVTGLIDGVDYLKALLYKGFEGDLSKEEFDNLYTNLVTLLPRIAEALDTIE